MSSLATRSNNFIGTDFVSLKKLYHFKVKRLIFWIILLHVTFFVVRLEEKIITNVTRFMFSLTKLDSPLKSEKHMNAE